jgi:hypothetical protein
MFPQKILSFHSQENIYWKYICLIEVWIKLSKKELATPQSQTLQRQNIEISKQIFQKRNIEVSVPISTFIRLWAIYIFPRSVCLFCWRKYVDRSWDCINRSQTHECWNWGWGSAIPRKGINKWDFVSVNTKYIL